MIKLKNFAAIALAFAISSGLSTVGFASTTQNYSDNPNVRVVNHSTQISEQALQELVNDINVSMEYDDGSVIPVNSVITVEDITSNNKSKTGAQEYQVSVRSKIESDADSKNNEGVSASIYLELRWIDNPFGNNVFESIEGNVDIDKGTISSSKVVYCDMLTAAANKNLNLGTKTSFYKYLGYEAFQPHASYHVKFVDATWELNVSVTPTFVD